MPDSKKSLSPVIRISAPDSIAARSTGLSFISLNISSSMYSSSDTFTIFMLKIKIEKNVFNEFSFAGNFLKKVLHNSSKT